MKLAGMKLAGSQLNRHRTAICATGYAHHFGVPSCAGIISCDKYRERSHLCASEPDTHEKCRCACHIKENK